MLNVICKTHKLAKCLAKVIAEHEHLKSLT